MKKPIREFVKSGIWYKYILDEMLYPDTDMTDEEKVTEFLKNAYSAEKYAIANRRSRIVDLYADYLMGLPTGVECIYWDDGMIAQVEEFTGRPTPEVAIEAASHSAIRR